VDFSDAGGALMDERHTDGSRVSLQGAHAGVQGPDAGVRGSNAGEQPGSRYARQLALPEVRPEGQQRLERATVLVVGAGGLGCAVLPYLCAAGIGRLIIVDHDVVDESNLHRQPLYRMDDIGQRKAEVAWATLAALNPYVAVKAVSERLTPDNAPALVAAADIIVDAADSFAVTYILSDECTRARKPLVSASVIGLSGYAGVFCGEVPSYRAVFPDLPAQAGTCATNGVLGTAVGVMGTLQAQMVLSLLLGLKPSVSGRMTTVDFRTLRFSGFSFLSAREEGEGFRFIARAEVTASDVTVELRGEQEAPVPAFASSSRLAPERVESVLERIADGTRVVLCCRTGLRAWRAAARLKTAGHHNLALFAAGD
jgi:molybdopterin/thiamine biosynthesis adenylyltransferase/rhodanese-related sulfurtransferase